MPRTPRFGIPALGAVTSVYEMKDDPMPKTTYALSDKERETEIAAITTCHEAMRDLRTSQRCRVLTWLQSWIDEESGRGI